MTPAYQLTVGELFKTPLANTPDEEIIHGDVMRYTYREARDRIGRLGSALARLGVGKGAVVAVMDWDSHRYYESYFAVPMMGATLHTVNVRLSPDQILFTINHAKDDAILIHRDFLPILDVIRSRIERMPRLILLEDAPGGPLPDGFDGEYEALVAAGDTGFAFPALDENTQATLFYTTGTTGDPKGVTFTHRQIVLHTLGAIASISPVPDSRGLHRRDVYMPITPMFHVHAWGFPFVATLLGIRQIYPGRYEPSRLLALIRTHGVTFSHCVPAILNMLLTAPDSGATDLSKWKVLIGGAALTPGLARAAVARGIDIHAAYGMSETCPLLTVADITATAGAGDTIALRTATGKAGPLVELSLRDDDMGVVDHDGRAQGEVTARAPWLTESYLGNPQGTDALWLGGWLHTGDVGVIDEKGTLRIVDRIKDVIKSGGEWVSSLELESLASHVAGVAEVAAIGLPDERWDERPCLVVALAPGATEADVTAEIRAAMEGAIAAGHLPKWAAPKQIEFVAALPKTSVGKIDKKKMRKDYA